MGKGPRKPRLIQSIGLGLHQTLGDSNVGGGLQDQLRRALANKSQQTTNTAPSSVVIGQTITNTGSDDVVITEIPDGVYLVNVLYVVGFDVEPASGYVRAELYNDGTLFASVQSGIGAGGGAEAKTSTSGWFLAHGGALHGVGSNFVEAAMVESEALTVSAVRVA